LQVDKLQDSLNDIFTDMDNLKLLFSKVDTNKRTCDALQRNLVSVEERMDMVKESINERLRDLESILLSIKEDIQKLDNESNRQGGLIIQINQRIDTLEIKVEGYNKGMVSGFSK